MGDRDNLVLRTLKNGVTTLTLNNPRRLNGWTQPMMEAVTAALNLAAADAETKAVVLTGTDPYYCAGVNLASTAQPQHPAKLRELIIVHNQALFDQYLDFPKPILVAVNGPALGAAVTSATLCDGMIASDKATFSTPFARLGLTPEGCSSALFERLMSAGDARRMLGDEGWAPTATEALEAGFIQWMVPHEQLLDEAQRIAEEWVTEGRERTYRGGMTREALKAVNARESVALADAFLAAPFLKGQFKFLWRKKKRGPAAVFLALWLMRPLWSRLL